MVENLKLIFFLLKASLNCQSNPCKNGAKCANAINSIGYVCICPVGFSGVNCQTGNDLQINLK